jgi:hypothetical protein
MAVISRRGVCIDAGTAFVRRQVSDAILREIT